MDSMIQSTSSTTKTVDCTKKNRTMQQPHDRRRRRSSTLASMIAVTGRKPYFRPYHANGFLSLSVTLLVQLVLLASIHQHPIDAFRPHVGRTTSGSISILFSQINNNIRIRKRSTSCTNSKSNQRKEVLFLSTDDIVHDKKLETIENNSKIRLLGKGDDAIVKLGVVIVPPVNIFHHFYRQSAIFIYDMGYDNSDGTDRNNVRLDPMPLLSTNNEKEEEEQTYYIRGVILDHPTPFTVSEMIPNTSPSSTYHDHLMFRGGDRGRENSVILLHDDNHRSDVATSSVEIGTSGIYMGGWNSIMNTTSTDMNVDHPNCKFFFNYCEFTENEIETLFGNTSEINTTSHDDNDQWMSVEIVRDPSSIILNNDWDRGDCFRYIRNTIVQQQQEL